MIARLFFDKNSRTCFIFISPRAVETFKLSTFHADCVKKFFAICYVCITDVEVEVEILN